MPCGKRTSPEGGRYAGALASAHSPATSDTTKGEEEDPNRYSFPMSIVTRYDAWRDHIRESMPSVAERVERRLQELEQELSEEHGPRQDAPYRWGGHSSLS